jgi:putative lipoprotein
VVRIFRWSTTLLLLAALAACGSRQDHSAGGEQPATAGAELEVQLQDISRPDAMASVLESVVIPLDGGPPYPFAIEYDKSRIEPRTSYALRATISVQQQLMFSTTEYIDPFTGNPLELLVQRLAELEPQ